MNKEESNYLMGAVLQEAVYKNPNKNLVKEKIKEIKQIMEKEYGIYKATLPQITFHALTYYINQHKKNEEIK